MSGPSPVEDIKKRSRLLRGGIADGLVDPLTGALDEDDTQLTKFHGIYQQDDRDVRSERRRQKLEPAYRFMIRARVPAGECSADQWLAMDRLARTHANGSLRLTSRQAFQFHGVVKRKLKSTIQGINDSLLDTLAACGDVNRNVMCSPNPELSEVHAEVALWASRLSDHLTPSSRAYHEIWLDGEKLDVPESEPVYGPTYLPRKFKAAFVVPPVNDVDIYTQDLGLVAIVEDRELIGFNVLVGGGMGMTHGDTSTFPRLADVLGFVRTDDVLSVAEAVVTTQRDHGDRKDRKHARLKYTLERMGLDAFRSEVESRSGVTLTEPRDYVLDQGGDRYGWTEDHQGQWHYTVFVPNGRVKDEGDRQLLSGLREVARVHRGAFRLTPDQNVIISGVAAREKAALQSLIEVHGLDTERLSAIRARAIACVAFPTCGLAMAESERYLPGLLDRLEAMLEVHGLEEEPLVLRMTGCPNGCARPYLGEIGLVGKGPGRYNLYLGAGFAGHRLNRLYRENADEGEILAALEPLFGRWARERNGDERFGDFVVRAGIVAPVHHGRDFHSKEA